MRRKRLLSHSGTMGLFNRPGVMTCLKWRPGGAFGVLKKASPASVLGGSETDGGLVVDGSMVLIVLPAPPAL